MHNHVSNRCHGGGAGDGEDPGGDDALAPDPTDGACPAAAADAKDGAGDGVSGGDGDAHVSGGNDGGGGGGFRTEAADGCEAGDARSKRSNDAPAAEHGAGGDSNIAGHHDPEGDVVLVAEERVLLAHPAWMAGGGEKHDDDAHGFLGIVAAVAEAEDGGGEELEAAEPAIDFSRMSAAEDPGGGGHEQASGNEAD